MNKKFVKENKKALKEFLGNVISSIVAGTLSKSVDKESSKFPELQQSRKEVEKLSADLNKKLEKIKKHSPDLYKKIKNRSLKYYK
jgi:hypothetical protein